MTTKQYQRHIPVCPNINTTSTICFKNSFTIHNNNTTICLTKSKLWANNISRLISSMSALNHDLENCDLESRRKQDELVVPNLKRLYPWPWFRPRSQGFDLIYLVWVGFVSLGLVWFGLVLVKWSCILNFIGLGHWESTSMDGVVGVGCL